MSESMKLYDVNSEPTLSNAATIHDVAPSPSFRNPIPSTSTVPMLPPRPDSLGFQSSYGMNGMNSMYGGMGSYGMGSMGSYGMGGYGMGSYGMGGMGGYGMGMGAMNPYGGYNRFGQPMYGDVETRFIQMAEESTRPAFDSIQSIVGAVGSVAMMLENTFFALTSSFRAILGVAENFGRLRSLFAQVWSTFAVVRTLNWMIRKLMVIMGLRTENEFKAWAEAVQSSNPTVPGTPQQGQASGSSWPILMFFGIIAAAPYIVLKMLSGLTQNISEKLHDPTSWQNPLRAVAQHDFQATSPQELSFTATQVLTIAPQHLQGNLWNSGWLMASTDRKHAGLVPVNYIKVIKPSEGKKDDKVATEMLSSSQELRRI